VVVRDRTEIKGAEQLKIWMSAIDTSYESLEMRDGFLGATHYQSLFKAATVGIRS